MSEALNLPLKLAAQETIASGYREITPAHLLIGLSRLSDTEPLSPPVHKAAAAIRREFEALGIEPKTFRRRLRALLAHGGSKFDGEAIHRSIACKRVFAIGALMARQEGALLEPRHLLRAALIASSLEPRDDPADPSPAGRGPDEDLPEEL